MSCCSFGRRSLSAATPHLLCLLLFLLFLGLGPLSGCASHEPAAEAKAKAASEPAAPPPVVTVSQVARHTWGQSVRVHGTLLPDETAVVGCKIAGRVAEMLVDVGDLIRKGQPIARLDEVQLQLEVKHTQALLAQACAAIGLDPKDAGSNVSPEQSPVVKQERALLEQATLDLERARTLRRQGVTTQEDLDQREADYKVAVARYSASLNSVGEKIALIQVRQSEVELAKNAIAESTIYAPFDGIVEERHTAAGAYVKTGDPVVSLVRCDKVRFLGAVPEKQAHLVMLGQEVRIHLRNEPEPRVVQVSRLRPQIDPASRALMFEADVENPNFDLQPGLFAEADVVVDPAAQALVIPESAVVEFAGVEKVWRVVDGMATEAIIRTGAKRDGQVIVASGIEPGDVIVTEGAQGRAGKVQVSNMPAATHDVGVAE